MRFHGTVLHGAKLGRTIGFPTANIAVQGVRPEIGIYAARATLEDGRTRLGVAYYGRRPTVDGTDELLEVFLFDFAEEIYGAHLSVDLLCFVREDINFSSVDDMAAQIRRDCDRVLRRFGAMGAAVQ